MPATDLSNAQPAGASGGAAGMITAGGSPMTQTAGQFVGGKPRQNACKTLPEIPAQTAESDTLSKDLVKRGFKFVGSIICYAFMQAVGMVNDHVVDCFRYQEVQAIQRMG